MRRVLAWVSLMFLSACSIQQPPLRTLTAVIPAVDITAVALQTNVGEITLSPSSDANIHLSVSLEPSSRFLGLFTPRDSESAVRAATLGHTLTNGTLTLRMQYPTDSENSGVSEHWVVALPASMHVSSRVSVGSLSVSGMAGGVEADMNVGKVQLDVPGGALKLTVNVGKIQASIHSLNYGEVTLVSDVGNSLLTVDGVTVGDRQKSGAGESVSWKGGGKNAINMQVNTGKLSVALVTH